MPVFQIFLSSIFRDMEEERDALNRIVMPKIRKECMKRGIDFSYVDLRWGIDDEMLKQGKVIDHCLNQIASTSPVFLGMIGPRYGSILPHSADRELSATHHEFRCAMRTGHELIFLVRDDANCRAARSGQPNLARMLEETPAENRAYYLGLEEFIAVAEMRLLEVLDRRHPLDAESDPILDAAARQSQHHSLIRSRFASLWQGHAAQGWLGYLKNISKTISDETRSHHGIFPVIVQTAGDAEVIAAELTVFHQQHGPEGDLVFDHASGIEGDRSGAWVMRRLLAYLAAETDIWPGPSETPSDAQVQVLLNIALADLAQENRHLLVVLSRADPVEMLLYMRPLLMSRVCTVVTTLTEVEAQTLPVTIPGFPPPVIEPSMSTAILETTAISFGKAPAMKANLIDVLTSSPLCQTLTGTTLLADWLMAWGDLNPAPGASQDAWVQREVERIAGITSLEALSSEVLSAVCTVIMPIVPDIEHLSETLLACLRVAPVALTLDELQEVAEEVICIRGLSCDAAQVPFAATYLAKAFTSVEANAHSYRMIEPAIFEKPADASAISSAIIRALTNRSADYRRAEGAARCANSTRDQADRRRVLNTAGFAARIETSLLTALAAGLEGVAATKSNAILDECTSADEQLLVDDALALISSLMAHDEAGCLILAETVMQHLNAGARKRSALTSTLAAKAQAALDRSFEKHAAELHSITGGAANPFDDLRRALILHKLDRDSPPREAQDFLQTITANAADDLQSKFDLLRIQNDLRHAVALDTFGGLPATVALKKAKLILTNGFDDPRMRDFVGKLSAFAIKLTIASEEGRFANAGASTLRYLDRENIRADSFFTDRDSIVSQTMRDMLRLAQEASDLGRNEVSRSIVKSLVESLANSDRRFEYSELLRLVPVSPLQEFIKNRWSQHHRPGEREHVSYLMVNALADLRRVPYFV